MTTSTMHMLRVMQPLMSKTETDDIVSPIKDISEKQPQLTPSSSPSMVDLLNYCLSPNKGPDSTPLK